MLLNEGFISLGEFQQLLISQPEQELVLTKSHLLRCCLRDVMTVRGAAFALISDGDQHTVGVDMRAGLLMDSDTSFPFPVDVQGGDGAKLAAHLELRPSQLVNVLFFEARAA